MTEKISLLINQKIDNEKKKSELEFQVLQSQINPHFIYNTLDSIKWLAIMNNAHNVGDMADALIKLLKYNIVSNPTATLDAEIQSIVQYLKLQKCRYGDFFAVEYDISEETLGCMVIRFMLQPVVENCILHGFHDMEGGALIRIRAYRHADELIVAVEDNGSGTDKDMAAMLAPPAAANADGHMNGIGLNNINNRINLQFGSKYGLSMKALVGGGLSVIITLPFNTSV